MNVHIAARQATAREDRTERYHKEYCRYYKDGMLCVSKERARMLGLQPCQNCIAIDGHTTPHCPAPECHSSQIKPLNGGFAEAKTVDYDWKCRDCGNHFDEPKQLPSTGSVRDDTKAGMLDQMDPDVEIVADEEVDQ
jgi:hypothetical protein